MAVEPCMVYAAAYF